MKIMEKKKISKSMREELRKPLPSEAISQHPTKTFLSSIKAIYVLERLNDVFGVGTWTTKVIKINESNVKPRSDGFIPIMVVVKLIFEIPEYGIYYESYGGNDNEDRGDAYKGAVTDALTKIGSFLEIGIDVFKGKGNKSDSKLNKPQKTEEEKLEAQVKFLEKTYNNPSSDSQQRWAKMELRKLGFDFDDFEPDLNTTKYDPDYKLK